MTVERYARVRDDDGVVRWVRFAEGADQLTVVDVVDGPTAIAALAAGPREAGRSLPRVRATLLAPVAPQKVFGVGANFVGDDEAPSKEIPSVFSMPTSAVVGSGVDVVLPAAFDSVLVEGELAVVIGRRARDLDDGQGAGAIFGFTLANDLSGRASSGPFASFVPPALKKGSDGFLPLGPCIARGLDWRTLSLSTTINEAPAQHGKLAELMFPCERVVELVSRFVTLQPGDVISMGTPPPKPKARRGDVMRVHVDGVGSLVNKLV